MTKTQRAVIERVMERAERGPSLGPAKTLTREEAENRCRIWAQSWITENLHAVLLNDDGVINASQLGEFAR